jgi:hypothetical protein
VIFKYYSEVHREEVSRRSSLLSPLRFSRCIAAASGLNLKVEKLLEARGAVGV